MLPGQAAFWYVLILTLGSILGAIFVISLWRPDLVWKAVNDLRTTLVPLALALVLWPFIRWPSPHLWDQVMLASVLVLAPLGIVALVVYIVRSLFFR
jgi:hypothetical protein